MISNTQPLIYVVDDDPDEHYLLQTIFERHHADCTLRYFIDGDQLLIQLTHCLDGRLPDLILLDWHMPILSGYDVLQLLRNDKKWRSIPVIVRSGFGSDQEIVTCYKLGGKAFIFKEITYQRLTDSIATLCYDWLS